MIGALLLVAVAALAFWVLRQPKQRKPTVYLSGGPQRVLSAAELRRAVSALRPEKREELRAWSETMWNSLRMGERG